MSILIGACGINCQVCKNYIEGLCSGCTHKEDTCPVAYCVKERGVKACYYCSEFPCVIYTKTKELIRDQLRKQKGVSDCLRV